jgi:hypothetical protein
LLQPIGNLVIAASSESRNILNEQPSRSPSDPAQQPKNLEEQSAAGSRQARPASGGGDVLAGEAEGPEVEIVGDAGEAAGEGETADAGEQVDLPAVGDFFRPDEPHVASVNRAFRQPAFADPLTQHLATICVDFIVVRHGPVHPPCPAGRMPRCPFRF